MLLLKFFIYIPHKIGTGFTAISFFFFSLNIIELPERTLRGSLLTGRPDGDTGALPPDRGPLRAACYLPDDRALEGQALHPDIPRECGVERGGRTRDARTPPRHERVVSSSVTRQLSDGQ